MLKAHPEAARFELMQRKAAMYASSSLVPKEYQKNQANCAIAINIAERLGADEFAVMQSMDVIHGRPSWRSQFLIAMVNTCGRFTPIKYRQTGKRGTDSWGMIAHCKDKETGETLEGPEVTIDMAKKEGWYSKNGSKWQTIPELMLMYRSGAFFSRLYAPDVTLGMLTREEIDDMGAKAGFEYAKPVESDEPKRNPFADVSEAPVEPEREAEQAAAPSEEEFAL